MLSRFRISVPLCQPKVNEVANMLFFVNSHQKVIWLHVTMYEVLVVKEFKSLNHLISNHENSPS